jgi:hypothetical protein
MTSRTEIIKAQEKMKEIVINRQFGGFSLSMEAMKEYLKLKGKKCFIYVNKDWKQKTFEKLKVIPNERSIFPILFFFTKDFGEKFKEPEMKSKEYDAIWNFHFSDRDISRDDLDLIKVVKKLGDKSNGSCATLEIVKIPADIKWVISEYDGLESVEEEHRSWN